MIRRSRAGDRRARVRVAPVGVRRLRAVALVVVASGVVGAAPAAAAPAVPADAFRDGVGVNTHVMHPDSPYWDLPQLTAALRYLGVHRIRDGVRWYRTRATQWFVIEQERRFRALAEDGVRMQLLLPGPNDGYGTVREALDVMAATGGTTSVEVANEWDLNGDPLSWSAQLRPHVEDARAEINAHPRLRGTPLVGPSFGRPGSPERFGDVSAAIDYGNAHPYADGTRPEAPERPWQWSLDRSIAAMRLVSRDRPFMFTESGYHDAIDAGYGQAPVDRPTAAVYTVRTLLEHVRAGASRTYLYELADSFADDDLVHPEGHFGLFDVQWRPKPAATAVRNLLAVLRDPTPAPRGAALAYTVAGPQDDLRQLLFSRPGGGFTLALWRTASVWDSAARRPVAAAETPVTLSLPRPFETATMYRPVRGAAPTEQRRDVTTLPITVGPDPVLVDLDPSARTGAETPAPAPAASTPRRPWWCSWFSWAC